MSEDQVEPPKNVLDPMERISEVLFGTIMALTFTCTLGIATADDIQVRTMLFGALGCNLAWGIIDAGVYLLARVNNLASKFRILRAVQEAPDLAAAQRIIADALPPVLASVVPSEQLELMRQKLRQLPQQQEQPRLTRNDWMGAVGLCVLSFLSVFPIAIPFIFIGDARWALRISNVVAIAMLFVCGYAFGYRSGLRPWVAGLSMVAIGGVFVGVAIALGG
jgi:VIT1/CCC1 family predicted Fe2+/Mn2+ transporter